MAPPPKLPADLARRAEPPADPLARSREAEAAQLKDLLSVTARIEQSSVTSAASLHELRSELQTLRGQLAGLAVRALAVPPPPPPPPPSAASRVAAVAALIAAITALGALAGAALVIVEQKAQEKSLAAVVATTRSINQTVTQLGESVATLSPPGAAASRASAAGKPEPGAPAGTTPTEPPSTDGKPPVCPPGSSGKPRVLLPNLIGLRLAEARTTVAPLQLQLLPTDKKLKEASKIGWQLPNPGAELEPDEAVTVALKPPGQNKKKK